MPLDFIAPIEPIEGDFLSKTADVRVLDEAQQNIVAVTRQGRSELAKSFSANEMDYGWSAWARLLDGTEAALPYQQTSGPNAAIGYIQDGGTEYMGVSPQVNVTMIAPNQLRVQHTNLKPGTRLHVGDFWSRGADAYGGHDGTWTVTLPWRQNEGMAFVEIHDNNTGAVAGTGLFFRFRQGNVVTNQTYNFGNANIPSWMNWTRGTPAVSPGISAAKLINDSTFLGTTWTSDDVLIQPGKSEEAVLRWTSPATGTVKISALLQDVQQTLGDGVTYTLRKVNTSGSATIIQTGMIANGTIMEIADGTLYTGMNTGDKLELIVNATGTENDPNNNKGDPLKARLNVELTEAEKTYEKVTVAPSIQLRTTSEGNTLMVDYRNIPEGMKLRAHKRGTEWNDGNWGKWEITLPTGSGSVWVPVQGHTDAPQHVIDVYLVDSNSDNEAIEEKKLTFNYMTTLSTGRMANVPTARQYFGSRANDVLKDPLVEATDLDSQEVIAAIDYRTKLSQVPATRNWTEGQTFDARAQAESMGIYTGSYFAGGGQLVGNGGTYKVMYDLDNTKYQRHGVSSDGSAIIVRPWYMVKNGLKKLPQEFWRRLPNGEIITTPNGPQQIIYEVSLNGRYTGGPEDNSTTMEELMPIEGLHISGGIQQLKAELADTANTGFRGLITEFREASSPVLLPGTAVQMICQFESIGTIGGQITVKTTCGYTGDPNLDPVQGIDTMNFAVNGKYSLVRNVHAPGNPPTANARPIITVEVQYPDGRKEILGQRLAKVPTDRTFTRTDPATGRIISIYQDYTPEELAHMERVVARFEHHTGVRPTFIGDTSQGHAMTPNSYYERVAQELLRTNSENSRALAFGDQLLEAMERVNRDVFVDTFQQNQIEQYAGTTEAQTVLKIEQAGTAIGFCKENTNNTTVKNQLIALFTEMFGIPQARAESQVNSLLQQQGGGLNDALSWFNSNETIPEMEYYVRNDTAMSKAFLGMLQEAKSHNSDQDRIRIALTMQNITGIPVTKLLHVLQASDGVWSRIVGRMKNLFTTAQYGHIFVPKPGPEQEILMAQTNKDASHPYVSGEKIRIRFDLASSASDYDHILPYLWQNGMQVSDSPITNAETADKLFMELALSDVVKQSVASGMQIKLAAWVPVSPNQSGFRTISALSNVIAVPEHVELAFDPQEVVGAQWLTLNDAQKTTVRNALNFGEGIPEKNAELINWLVNFITNKETLSTQSSQLKWIGEAIQDDPNDDRDNNNLWGECKYWLQTNVLKDGFDIQIQSNKPNKFSWYESSTIESRTIEGEIGTNFQSIISNPDLVRSGDMIQIYGGSFSVQHTMVIGKIENDGIWVFDSNFVQTKTPGYHKIKFSSFNGDENFTIYRLK